MRVWAGIVGAAFALIAVAILIGYLAYRKAASEADAAYNLILTGPQGPRGNFDPRRMEALPEIAKRYSQHAIEPGTPLYSTAELRMHGTFLLGDRRRFQTYAMTARQALKPPDEFVWIPHLQSGPLAVTGSDALANGRAWTRFWLLSFLPVANDQSSPDLVRSAQFRAAVEGALWVPSSLLPGNGVEWKQTGRDEAVVTLTKVKPKPIALTLKLARNGAVREVVGQRWSNANPDKHFRLQPFGGVILEEGTFQRLTIPTKIAVGNHYGTPDYLPLFRATVTSVRFR